MNGFSHSLNSYRELRQRQRRDELMDQPTIGEVEHRQALAGLARINWLSNSSGIFWPPLRRLADTLDHPLRVLDVACGGGDVTIALAQRARRAGLACEFTGCDMSAVALAVARDRADAARLPVTFSQLNVLESPLSDDFDAIICSLFLHHVDEPDAETLLRSMAGATRRMVLVNDLARSRYGYFLAQVVARILSRSHVVHVDGPLSVAGAFTPDEAVALSLRAGLTGATVRRHWPERFLLEWHKS